MNERKIQVLDWEEICLNLELIIESDKFDLLTKEQQQTIIDADKFIANCNQIEVVVSS